MSRSSAPHFETYCSWDLQPSPGSDCDGANDGQVRHTESGTSRVRRPAGGAWWCYVRGEWLGSGASTIRVSDFCFCVGFWASAIEPGAYWSLKEESWNPKDPFWKRSWKYQEPEDTLHVLRDCSAAKEIWKHIIPDNQLFRFFSGTLDDWFNINLDCHDSTNYATYIPIENNLVVDYLAKLSLTRSGLQIFDDAPNEVLKILQQDRASGVFFSFQYD
ncbi:hypothetical protein Gotur_035084, partial [Gossypium turneri]